MQDISIKCCIIVFTGEKSPCSVVVDAQYHQEGKTVQSEGQYYKHEYDETNHQNEVTNNLNQLSPGEQLIFDLLVYTDLFVKREMPIDIAELFSLKVFLLLLFQVFNVSFVIFFFDQPLLLLKLFFDFLFLFCRRQQGMPLYLAVSL
jgi:hypothetical protein